MLLLEMAAQYWSDSGFGGIRRTVLVGVADNDDILKNPLATLVVK
jgi:hypothetical protein